MNPGNEKRKKENAQEVYRKLREQERIDKLEKMRKIESALAVARYVAERKKNGNKKSCKEEDRLRLDCIEPMVPIIEAEPPTPPPEITTCGQCSDCGESRYEDEAVEPEDIRLKCCQPQPNHSKQWEAEKSSELSFLRPKITTCGRCNASGSRYEDEPTEPKEIRIKCCQPKPIRRTECPIEEVPEPWLPRPKFTTRSNCNDSESRYEDEQTDCEPRKIAVKCCQPRPIHRKECNFNKLPKPSSLCAKTPTCGKRSGNETGFRMRGGSDGVLKRNQESAISRFSDDFPIEEKRLRGGCGSCGAPKVSPCCRAPPPPCSLPPPPCQKSTKSSHKGCPCGGCGGAACSDNSRVQRTNTGCCGGPPVRGKPCKCTCQSCDDTRPEGGCGGRSCGKIYSCAGSSGGRCCFPRNHKRRSGPECCGGADPSCGGCC